MRLVCQLLQLPSLHPAPVGMRQLLQEQASSSSASTSASACEPVLFVSTAGADPSQELAAFADAEIGRERLHEVAMGQGQAEVALQLLKECAETGECAQHTQPKPLIACCQPVAVTLGQAAWLWRAWSGCSVGAQNMLPATVCVSGDWLLLKNLHLVVSWLPALEREVHKLGPGRHSGFRLFLASQPHTKFPQTLLERSIKVGASHTVFYLGAAQPASSSWKCCASSLMV